MCITYVCNVRNEKPEPVTRDLTIKDWRGDVSPVNISRNHFQKLSRNTRDILPPVFLFFSYKKKKSGFYLFTLYKPWTRHPVISRDIYINTVLLDAPERVRIINIAAVEVRSAYERYLDICPKFVGQPKITFFLSLYLSVYVCTPYNGDDRYVSIVSERFETGRIRILFLSTHPWIIGVTRIVQIASFRDHTEAPT